jgi:hypothetical protein
MGEASGVPIRGDTDAERKGKIVILFFYIYNAVNVLMEDPKFHNEEEVKRQLAAEATLYGLCVAIGAFGFDFIALNTVISIPNWCTVAGVMAGGGYRLSKLSNLLQQIRLAHANSDEQFQKLEAKIEAKIDAKFEKQLTYIQAIVNQKNQKNDDIIEQDGTNG